MRENGGGEEFKGDTLTRSHQVLVFVFVSISLHVRPPLSCQLGMTAAASREGVHQNTQKKT